MAEDKPENELAEANGNKPAMNQVDVEQGKLPG